MNDLVISVVPSVELVHDQPTVMSLAIAQHFRKRHTEVLRSIRTLDCSPAFRQRNFASADYTDAQGKPREAIRMTRDGFMFLVMGYTGQAAARVKEAYIQRFNEMEARFKVSASELIYLQRRERELVSSLRRNVRLQGQVIRLQKQMLRGLPLVAVPAQRNQPDLFGGAQ